MNALCTIVFQVGLLSNEGFSEYAIKPVPCLKFEPVKPYAKAGFCKVHPKDKDCKELG